MIHAARPGRVAAYFRHAVLSGSPSCGHQAWALFGGGDLQCSREQQTPSQRARRPSHQPRRRESSLVMCSPVRLHMHLAAKHASTPHMLSVLLLCRHGRLRLSRDHHLENAPLTVHDNNLTAANIRQKPVMSTPKVKPAPSRCLLSRLLDPTAPLTIGGTNISLPAHRCDSTLLTLIRLIITSLSRCHKIGGTIDVLYLRG